jgi:tRNA G18 (ribose-2'-O)-methylase SpoU
MAPLTLALFQPDIPQNAGTMLRTCACLGVSAAIIEPAGFPVSDRHFRRAGMDYLDQVAIERHMSWRAFEEWRAGARRRLVLLTTRGALAYTDFTYRPGDIQRRACPTRCTNRPTRASSFPSSRQCAASMWPWPRRWFWAKLYGN